MSLELIFESHATSLDNEAHLASGWNDAALSPAGEQQAREMGVRYAGQHFDAIFCSDLQRSYRTAELAFGNTFPIIQDKRLRECDYGDLTQADKKLVDAEKPKRITKPFPNGESYTQTDARLQSFLADLCRDYAEQRVMVIGHRATQYGIERAVTARPLAGIVTAPWSWQPGWRYELTEAAAADGHKLTTFFWEGRPLSVNFVETIPVKEGVSCDTYRFEGDASKDLAIVTVQKGSKTPLQRVLRGEETVEGFVSGEGMLTVWAEDGTTVSHRFSSKTENKTENAAGVTVGIGQCMQWHAGGQTGLVFYEVCTPPYRDGRFENLPD